MLVQTWLERHPDVANVALLWFSGLGDQATMQQAWDLCPSADWMGWGLQHGADFPLSPLRAWAAYCAEAALTSEQARGQEPDSRSWAAARAARTSPPNAEDILAAAWDAAWDLLSQSPSSWGSAVDAAEAAARALGVALKDSPSSAASEARRAALAAKRAIAWATARTVAKDDATVMDEVVKRVLDAESTLQADQLRHAFRASIIDWR